MITQFEQNRTVTNLMPVGLYLSYFTVFSSDKKAQTVSQ
jgi:hypothetical protein